MRTTVADPVYLKRKKRFKLLTEILMSGLLCSLLPRGTPRRPDQIKKVLIIRHNALGDAVVSSVLIQALSTCFPGVQVDVLASRYNKEAFTWIPGVSRIHTWPDATSQRWQLIKSLRQEGYDVVLQTLFDENYMSRSIVARMIAGTGWLIGHDRGTPFARLLDDAITLPFGAYTGKLLSLLQNLQPKGAHALSNALRRYQLVFPQDVEQAATRSLESVGLQPKGFVLLNLSAREPTRNLSVEQAVFLANALAQDGHAVLLSCAPSDKDRAEQVRRASPTLLSCDFNSTGHAMCVASKAKLYVGPDTGTAHFAAVTSTPCVSLFHSGGRPESWSPYGTSYVSIQAHVGRLVKDIDPAFILRQARTLLKGEDTMVIVKTPTDFYAPTPDTRHP